jgi:hypothetical protein
MAGNKWTSLIKYAGERILPEPAPQIFGFPASLQLPISVDPVPIAGFAVTEHHPYTPIDTTRIYEWQLDLRIRISPIDFTPPGPAQFDFQVHLIGGTAAGPPDILTFGPATGFIVPESDGVGIGSYNICQTLIIPQHDWERCVLNSGFMRRNALYIGLDILAQASPGPGQTLPLTAENYFANVQYRPITPP